MWNQVPLGRIWRPLLAFAGPAAVIILILASTTGIGGSYTLFAVLTVLIGTGFLVQALLSDIAALGRYIERLREDPGAVRPALLFYGALTPIALAARDAFEEQSPGAGLGGVSTPGLDRLPDPVLMLDARRRVTRANIAARELLGDTLAGRDLATVLRNPDILLAVDDILSGTRSTAELEFDFSIPVERNFSARISGLEEDGNTDIAVVIALYDVTEMKRSERMRSDFIANISHELRTPLSVMLGSLQTLQGAARDDPEAQKQFFGLMENQSERMSRLVDDLLSLSRIEMNEHAVPTQIVDIGDVLDEVISTLSLKATDRSIRIEAQMERAFQDVPGDRADLSMVFQNLLDNAIKYGAEKSVITIETKQAAREDLPSVLRADSDYIEVSFHDQGPGIEAGHIPRLTERFYRVDSGQSRQLGGTGLGLAIVKHAVNRHRGALTINSEAGVGSIFTVFLPARRNDPEAQAAP